VQTLFTALHANGYVVERSQLSAIDPTTGRGLPDRYVEGTCPICGYDGARGDQCDNCGNQLDPQDLKDPRSKIDGKPPKFVESAQFFLELPAFAEALGGWLQTRQGWRPNVLKFSENLIGDLKPRAITRDLDWGVPDPAAGVERPGRQAHLRVVRRGDRLPVRLGGVGPAHRRPGRLAAVLGRQRRRPLLHGQGQRRLPLGDLAGDPARRERQAGRHPGPLGELALPTEVVSSEFLTMEGRKFSSSRSVVIYVRDVLERYGADPLRYYLSVAGRSPATPTSPGSSSSPATTPSWSRAGATWSTAR
jgi:methionyl-tRNA synthetase